MAIDIGVVKTPDGKFRGWSQQDDIRLQKMRAKLKRMQAGAMMMISYKQPRNLKHHRKFFALVHAIVANSETYDTEEKALIAVKLAAGHVDFVPDPKTGELTAVPKSVSFPSMDQDEFEEFYERAVQGVITHICPHMTRLDLDRAIEMVAHF